MDQKEFIASGILELYVAGTLSEEESTSVYNMMQQHTEVHDEVVSIENAIVELTAATAGKDTSEVFEAIKAKLGIDEINTSKVVPIMNKQKRPPIWLYVGWAASILLGIGLLFSVLQNNELSEEIEVVKSEKETLKEQMYEANSDLTAAQDLLAVLRSKDIISVPLGGQQVSPESYAKVYWDKKDNTVYLDLQGLPEPPKGKVYQVWSLKLEPLTPTSLGVISEFSADEDKVFNLQNANESEAFGITLEPEGGSESPTLEQLYTLGVVNNPAS